MSGTVELGASSSVWTLLEDFISGVASRRSFVDALCSSSGVKVCFSRSLYLFLVSSCF